MHSLLLFWLIIADTLWKPVGENRDTQVHKLGTHKSRGERPHVWMGAVEKKKMLLILNSLALHKSQVGQVL